MQEKTGRPRRLTFGDTPWTVGMFFELGDRVYDQVEHLPDRVLHSCPRDSYLSPARVILHLVASDLRRLSLLVPGVPAPQYAPHVAGATSPDLATLETTGVEVTAVLRSHLDYRRTYWLPAFLAPGFLEEPLEDTHFATRGDVVGHMIWHWSFHSGHIGAVTLEQGYEYHWTSETRVPGGTP